jgi:F0F1-type ATP synthase assembly protein I
MYPEINSYMIIISIVSGITVGWILGNYLLDRWINNGIDDINENDKEDEED